MWVEAIVAKEDLAKVMDDLCPLRINIGEGGNVLLSDPRDVILVDGAGLQMTITVQIHWPVLGVQIPVSIRAATLEVNPEILETADRANLTFKLHLDNVDIAIFPALIDRGIVDLVNKELAAKHVELAWGFMDTLSHCFDLPDALASARALDLRATNGRVKVTGKALALAVLFEARVEPRTSTTPPVSTLAAVPLPPRAGPPPPPPRPPSLRAMLRGSPGSLAAVFGVAFLSGMGLFALVSASRR
jgi:hypothetical protein